METDYGEKEGANTAKVIASGEGRVCRCGPSTSAPDVGRMAVAGGEEGEDGEEIRFAKPRKAMFRQRAHCNPLSDSYIVYPCSPDYVNWSIHFPAHFNRRPSTTTTTPSTFSICATCNLPLQSVAKDDDGAQLYVNTVSYPVSYPERQPDCLNGSSARRVEVLDVGCGFGGLLVFLSPRFPSLLMMGMEIREKVANFVAERIRRLRAEHRKEGLYTNISVLKSNVMKFLPNYIRKRQLKKMFFCFPDPHFKRSNWRRRIINRGLLSMYAFVLTVGGRLYTVTDVPELHEWMLESLRSHPMFEELSEIEMRDDNCVDAMENVTEEGKKVKRMGQPCFSSVFRRIQVSGEEEEETGTT
eukprot:GHVS01108838.1.p1 GENE.GHVS01108838.1~~GHVS01108838.1.p1  ORF type:complete len:356 (+),score=61.35 GHVS01108838.1:69-1136(+)